MKHISFTKTRLISAACALAIMGSMTTGCIMENLDSCPPPPPPPVKTVYKDLYRIVIQQLNAQDEYVNDGYPTTLFIFDEEGAFLETKEIPSEITGAQDDKDRLFTLPYPADAKLQIVALANYSKENQSIPTITKGSKITDMNISFFTEGDVVSKSADNLFHGNETLTMKEDDTDLEIEEGAEVIETLVVDTIFIMPKYSFNYITTRNLDAHLAMRGLRADNVTLDAQLHLNKTLNTINYKGEIDGDSVKYEPDGVHEVLTEINTFTTQEWVTPELGTYMPEDEVSVSIDIDGFQIKEEKYDIDGNPLKTVKNDPQSPTLFVIEFDGDTGEYLGIRVAVRHWGSVDNPIEW